MSTRHYVRLASYNDVFLYKLCIQENHPRCLKKRMSGNYLKRVGHTSSRTQRLRSTTCILPIAEVKLPISCIQNLFNHILNSNVLIPHDSENMKSGPVFALKLKFTLALRASNPKNLLARPKTYWPDI